MSILGVVAIGRNEGDRLRRCLQSVVGQGHVVIYVDSGSTDGSVALARSLGAYPVELDRSIPFTAARARNTGFQALLNLEPCAEFVQFVDGDCEVNPAWLSTAAEALKARPDLAVVCGRRRERHPEASIYNRLFDLEWDTPIGESAWCGGDALMRVSALTAVDGFDSSIPAGEEPELCGRLRQQNWKILRIDHEMTLHDAAMLRLGQWWKREIRSGYGSLDVATRFQLPDFRQQVRNVQIWTAGWLFATLALAFLGHFLAASLGALIGFALGLSLLALQAARVTFRAARRLPLRYALAYALLNALGKWAQLWGHLLHRSSRRQGSKPLTVDYKSPRAA